MTCKSIAPSLVLALSFFCASSGNASVKFLAVGNPSAIRIQGEGKTIVSEKAAWKGDLFTGTFQVPLDSLETGIAMRDKHMKEKYLETAKYPNATIEFTACAMKAETTCEGKLTLHGVTKPVSIALKTAPIADKKLLKIDADFTVKLSDYGISIPKFANITVAEDVKVQVDSETAKP